MTFEDADIATIADQVFAIMLGLECAPFGDARPGGLETVVGCVQVTGAWHGAVTLDCSAQLARAAAAAMFEAAPDELTSAEVHDAVGELANMTGGNVKNLVPGACQLSLPAVAQGTDFRMSIPGSVVRNQVDFLCAAQPLRVTVLERQER